MWIAEYYCLKEQAARAVASAGIMFSKKRRQAAKLAKEQEKARKTAEVDAIFEEIMANYIKHNKEMGVLERLLNQGEPEAPPQAISSVASFEAQYGPLSRGNRFLLEFLAVKAPEKPQNLPEVKVVVQ